MKNRMSWNKLLSNQRLDTPLTNNPDDARTPFEKDYDRITFCSAFRRLGKKTQVHPLAQNDHIHSRLTHSLEVARVGKSLGLLCGKIIRDREYIESIQEVGQIVQAACLAHDIGNPPFGHAGEEAIRAWFSKPESAYLLDGLKDYQKDDFRYFEGNAQSFRILTRLERHRDKGGMRMTYATLATMLKYPWTTLDIKGKNKFCVFQEEKDNFQTVAEGVGLIKVDDDRYCRHPLAYLVEAADDICYRILDLEDACEMKLISLEDIINKLKSLCKNDPEYNEIINCVPKNKFSDRRKMAFIRAKSIGKSLYYLACAFDKEYEAIMGGSFNSDLIKSSEIEGILEDVQKLTEDKVFYERRKVELEIGSYEVISILLEVFLKAVRERVLTKEDKDLSFKSHRVLKILGNTKPEYNDDIYTAYLRATDYISGMTDNYASFMARQFSGMGT